MAHGDKQMLCGKVLRWLWLAVVLDLAIIIRFSWGMTSIDESVFLWVASAVFVDQCDDGSKSDCGKKHQLQDQGAVREAQAR
jgi:hypothetical protein